MSVWVKEIHTYLTYVVKEEQDPLPLTLTLTLTLTPHPLRNAGG